MRKSPILRDMAAATLTEKGQITIPRSIRKMLGLSPHQKILFVPKKGSVELVPVKGNLLDLFGAFHSRQSRKTEDWRSIRTEVRRRLVAKRVKDS